MNKFNKDLINEYLSLLDELDELIKVPTWDKQEYEIEGRRLEGEELEEFIQKMKKRLKKRNYISSFEVK